MIQRWVITWLRLFEVRYHKLLFPICALMSYVKLLYCVKVVSIFQIQ